MDGIEIESEDDEDGDDIHFVDESGNTFMPTVDELSAEKKTSIRDALPYVGGSTQICECVWIYPWI